MLEIVFLLQFRHFSAPMNKDSQIFALLGHLLVSDIPDLMLDLSFPYSLDVRRFMTTRMSANRRQWEPDLVFSSFCAWVSPVFLRSISIYHPFRSRANGGCGFGTYYGSMNVAPNTAWYNGSSSCGTCVEVFGPKGTITLTISDECPIADNQQWCSGDMTHFDLDQRAFPSLGETSWGVMLLNWRYVSCPTAANPVNVISKADSSSTWVSLLVRDHNTAVSSLEIRENNTATFTAITRQNYNQFEHRNQGGIKFPATLRVTNIYGDSITTTLSGPSAGQTVAFSRNFAVPSAVSGSCGAPYKYVIYDENINAPADITRRTAHDWTGACGSCNLIWQSTAVTAFEGTYSASASIQSYQEFYFATQGPVGMASSNLQGVEIALRTQSGSLAAASLQLFFESYNDNLLVAIPSINATWSKFVFPKSAFPTLPSSLTRVALKNNRNAVTAIYLDSFKLVPTTAVVAAPSGNSGGPAPSGGSGSVPKASGSPSLTAPDASSSPSAKSSSANASRVDSVFAAICLVQSIAGVLLLLL